MHYRNRAEAGRKLASELTSYQAKDYQDKDVVILALPRGGVPVAFEVAQALNAQLDVLVSRKIGAPHNSEYAIGAIAEKDVVVLDKKLIKLIGVSQQQLEQIKQQEKQELDRRVNTYRSGRSLECVQDKITVVIDDGLATGSTALAALKSARKLSPKELIFAAPVCAGDSLADLKPLVADIRCPYTPRSLRAIGLHYDQFDQVSDNEVVSLLNKAKLRFDNN